MTGNLVSLSRGWKYAEKLMRTNFPFIRAKIRIVLCFGNALVERK